MSRKRCRRDPVMVMPPRGLRPKFGTEEIRRQSLNRAACIDAIAFGRANEVDLSKWIISVYTWAKVAEIIGAGTEEMRAQLELVNTVSQRFLSKHRAVVHGARVPVGQSGTGLHGRPG